jgi:8-oxo-dGTP pyrophosphatase MutT (NUDIX family)
VKELARRLAPVPSTFVVDGREVGAAIAIILAPSGQGPSVLLIERSPRVEDPWSGQVAFPGGRRSPSDPSPLTTAVRETQEEVGLALGVDQALGAMGPWSPANRPSLLVLPLVFGLPSTVPTGTSPEARASFWVEFQRLPPARRQTTRLTIAGEVVLPCFEVDGRTVWGFTYALLEHLIVLLDQDPRDPI